MRSRRCYTKKAVNGRYKACCIDNNAVLRGYDTRDEAVRALMVHLDEMTEEYTHSKTPWAYMMEYYISTNKFEL